MFHRNVSLLEVSYFFERNRNVSLEGGILLNQDNITIFIYQSLVFADSPCSIKNLLIQ